MRTLSNEAAILLALGEGPASGVGLMRRLRSGREKGAPGAGTLYPLLGRLEKEGLVRTWMEHRRSGVGRPRRYVELTPRGLAELDRVREEILGLGARHRRPSPTLAPGRMRANLRRAFRASSFARRLRDASGGR